MDIRDSIDIDELLNALIGLSSLQLALGVIFVVKLILWLRLCDRSDYPPWTRCSTWFMPNFTVVVYFFTYNR